MCMVCVAQSTPFIGGGLTVLRRRTWGPYVRSKLPPRWQVSRKDRAAIAACAAAQGILPKAKPVTACKGHCKHGSHHPPGRSAVVHDHGPEPAVLVDA